MQTSGRMNLRLGAKIGLGIDIKCSKWVFWTRSIWMNLWKRYTRQKVQWTMKLLLDQAEPVNDISGSSTRKGIRHRHIVLGMKATGLIDSRPPKGSFPKHAEINATAGNANLSYTFYCWSGNDRVHLLHLSVWGLTAPAEIHLRGA